MYEIRKIAVKIVVLIIDVLCFGWDVLQKVILPNRHRKGNILSSILHLFTGLTERIISFEKSILNSSLVFKHRYVKQAFILAAGFLFLISSIEWSANSLPLPDQTNTLIAREQTETFLQEDLPAWACPLVKNGTGHPLKVNTITLHETYRESGPLVVIKRYLRYSILRI